MCDVFCQLCLWRDTAVDRRCFNCTRCMCTSCAVGAFICKDCHKRISQQGIFPSCRTCTIPSLNLEVCTACNADVCEICREYCSFCHKHYCVHHECKHSS